jgi:hypothetical protein
MRDDQKEPGFVWMHQESEYCKGDSDKVLVKCPHCGDWGGAHELQVNGCSCGAEVSSWMKFEKD